MAATPQCPDPARLKQLVNGSVALAEVEPLIQHVENCARCAETLAEVGGEDPLLALMRRATNTTTMPCSGGRVPPEWLARWKALLDSSTPPLVDTLPSKQLGSASTPSQPPSYAFLAPAQSSEELGRLAQYRLLKELGMGGMGIVFRAEDTVLKRQVALKVMKPELASNPTSRQRFQREAQLMASIEHDHIVTIYQVGEEQGVPFLAMPLLKGETLDQRLKREPQSPIAEILRLGRELAAGLASAHSRGLIHRDIKPGNLWLEGARSRLKILDFGLAREADGPAALTQHGVILGTPAYMSPEQAQGEAIDTRSDLFSVGVVLYRMATGQLPFSGPTHFAVMLAITNEEPLPPRALRPDLPAALDRVIMKLLAKNRKERPASAAELFRALTAVKRSLTANPEKPTEVEPLPDPEPTLPLPVQRKSRRGLLLAMGALVVVLATVGGGYWVIKELGKTKTPAVPPDPLAELREQSSANLRTLALACHAYVDARHHFPVGIIDPKSRRLGLSWRVQILPYLPDPSARALYDQFHLNEPWDSDHNKPLLASMPAVFAPVRGQAPPGYTYYQGFALHALDAKGKELTPAGLTYVQRPFPSLIFPDPRLYFPGVAEETADGRKWTPCKDVSFPNSFTDGTSNTILFVEAGEAVPWTRPQDIPLSLYADGTTMKARTIPKLGGMFDGDFHMVMADGAVKFVKRDPPMEKLIPFITPGQGEIVDWRGIGLEEPSWVKEPPPLPEERDGQPVPGSPKP